MPRKLDPGLSATYSMPSALNRSTIRSEPYCAAIKPPSPSRTRVYKSTITNMTTFFCFFYDREHEQRTRLLHSPLTSRTEKLFELFCLLVQIHQVCGRHRLQVKPQGAQHRILRQHVRPGRN